jgi:hypothetical protein
MVEKSRKEAKVPSGKMPKTKVRGPQAFLIEHPWPAAATDTTPNSAVRRTVERMRSGGSKEHSKGCSPCKM